MYPDHHKNEKTVVKTVQELLLSEEDKSLITPEKITETVDSLLSMKLYAKFRENLDYDFVIDELIRRNSIWIGQDSILINNVGHVAWLTTERKKDWRYWERYKEWQEKKLDWVSLNALDKSTDEILGLLEDPTRKDAWDRRGLVVGHVQSGKTGNFTGLICKAADAGYKIIIVLAGMHNNLRSQTQMRLDEGFLGYETHPDPEKIKLIGVGEIDSGLRPNYVTNRTDKGDFNKNLADGAGIRPEERPWLFVVKKNKTVLKRLHKWIHDHVANTIDPNTHQKIVTNLPLLVIDDEADHASVDTGEQIFSEDGIPEENYEPKAINSYIRKILNLFSRKAYVGYTATPFANIYIHEQAETKKEGKDLFPEAFILNLASPSNYIGPSRVFGINNGDGSRKNQLPIIHEIDDHNTNDGLSGWMPIKHKSDHKPYHESEFGIPLSLVEAIDAFILACVVRKIRKQGDEHSSMLIHVTRFNLVQKEVFEKVDEYVKKISQRLIRGIDNKGILNRLERLWEHDFIPTTTRMNTDVPDLCSDFLLPDWEKVKELLPEVIEQVSVRMINGTAKDALDYADSASGLKVIAIGGDKLARGLTLEGLCVSYFLRASKMYDTLMQMGRWFGYRPGYLDLCRLYTTSELIEWFEHISDASLELREEFNLMVESGGTPRDYGLKVKSHPVLMVTSPLKMRTAKTLKLSFSGTVSETVSFLKDERVLKNNFEALTYLINSLDHPHTIPLRFRGKTNTHKLSSNNFYWEAVSYTHILEFLEQYITHPESLKANSKMLKNFIEKMAEGGQLTSWNIALMGGSIKDHPVKLSDSLILHKAQRTSNGRHEDRYAIRRLLSPTDEALDLSDDEWNAALIRTIETFKDENPEKPVNVSNPSGIHCRYIRGKGVNGNKGRPDQGLLIIYLPEDVENNNSENELQRLDPFVGFACSFPHSELSEEVEYKVNNIEWESYYGPAI